MSTGTPAGKAPCAASGKLMGGRNVVTIVTGSMGITGDAQHAHVQRTQNAGQPLSGLDSLVPNPQVSGSTSEVTPLASAISRAKSTIKNARRIQSMVYHPHLRRPLPLGSTVELRNGIGLNWNRRQGV
jgi:hypothetical protein